MSYPPMTREEWKNGMTDKSTYRWRVWPKYIIWTTLLVASLLFISHAHADETIAQTTATTNTINGCGYSSGDTGWCGQSFTTTTGGEITGITIRPAKEASTGKIYHWDIYLADGSDHPTGGVLAQSNTMNQDTWDNVVSFQSCGASDKSWTFATSTTLAASTKYVAVLKPDSFSTSAGRFCGTTSSSYAGGLDWYTTSNLTTYTDPGGDFYFSISLVTPSGGGEEEEATTTDSTLSGSIDNPNQNTAMAVLIFLCTMFGLINVLKPARMR